LHGRAGHSGEISDNTFDGNGNGIVTESVDMVISRNTFSNSVGAHIAAVPFETPADVSSYVQGDNVFLDQDRPVSIYPNNAGAQDVTGTQFGDTFRGSDPTGQGNQGLSPGSLTFDGGEGNDRIFGSAQNDDLTGGQGDDVLDGGAGNDTMVGGIGDDTYAVDSVSDVIIENPNEGTDTAIVSVDGYVLAANVENAVAALTSGLIPTERLLYANAENNGILGSSGDDYLAGMAGNDTIHGSGGNDVLDGGPATTPWWEASAMMPTGSTA
jgi:Ca2+-binding RTX toxin-like protein